GVVQFRPVGAWGHVTDRWAPGVVEVRAQPVSEILEEHGIGRVDLVKMDVEGSEMAVIRGMRELLTGPDAPRVVYENNAHTQRMAGATPEDLIATFRSEEGRVGKGWKGEGWPKQKTAYEIGQ